MKITGPAYKESPNLHFFSRDLAGKGLNITNESFSIPAAILLADLARNIRKIKKYRDAKRAAYRKTDGWYYISVKDLAKRHPYLKERTVRRTLDRLRKAGILKTSTEFNKRKSEHTLWYSFADNDVFKEALAQEGAISFWVQDAIEYGIEAAILIRNLTWVEEHGLSKDGWTAINPVEFIEDTNLPMSVQAVRRALAVLVKAGRLERRRNRTYGNNFYKYRLVDTHHLGAYEEPGGLPTEAYESQFKDDLPTEYYETLPSRTAHREGKDKENQRLKEVADMIERIKAQTKPTPKKKAT